MNARRVLTALALAGALVVGIAAPASAQTGDVSKTVSCGNLQSPATGVAHAQLRNCTITWTKNELILSNSIKYSFQFRDPYTDGFTAAAYECDVNPGGSGCTYWYTGSSTWTTITISCGGCYVDAIGFGVFFGNNYDPVETGWFNNPYPDLMH